MTPPPGISNDRIAAIAAEQALTVPGVIRLQPGLRQAVGRAARMLFTPGAPVDNRTAADGIEVRVTPEPQLIVRIVTTAEPTPLETAGVVQSVVAETLLQQTGVSFTVQVVVIDVDPDA